jgi:hypothetical protein
MPYAEDTGLERLQERLACHAGFGLKRAGGGELSTVIDRGYKRAFAVLGVHSWFHTEQDTLEKTSAELLKPVIDAHERLIEAALAA